MNVVEVRGEINAPIERVWATLSDFGAVQRWNPYPKQVEVRGEGIGMVRLVTNQRGDTGEEELLELDPARRFISYTVVPTSSAPVVPGLGAFTTSIELVGPDDGPTAVIWQTQHGEVQVDEGTREALTAALQLRLEALGAFLAGDAGGAAS